MKIDGIPTKLDVDVKNTHAVALEVVVSPDTVDNIVDAVQLITVITVIGYAAKKGVDLAQRYGYEMIMKSVWRRG